MPIPSKLSLRQKLNFVLLNDFHRFNIFYNFGIISLSLAFVYGVIPGLQIFLLPANLSSIAALLRLHHFPRNFKYASTIGYEMCKKIFENNQHNIDNLLQEAVIKYALSPNYQLNVQLEEKQMISLNDQIYKTISTVDISPSKKEDLQNIKNEIDFGVKLLSTNKHQLEVNPLLILSAHQLLRGSDYTNKIIKKLNINFTTLAYIKNDQNMVLKMNQIIPIAEKIDNFLNNRLINQKIKIALTIEKSIEKKQDYQILPGLSDLIVQNFLFFNYKIQELIKLRQTPELKDQLEAIVTKDQINHFLNINQNSLPIKKTKI